MQGTKLKELMNYIDEFKFEKQISSDYVNKGFLSIKRGEYLLKNGKIIIREEILKKDKEGNYHSGSASIILPVTVNNKILLIVQPRVLTLTGATVELPAGYAEEGESSENAALRELKEETGYIPKKLVKIAEFYQDQGCSRALNSAFIAYGCEKKYKQNLDKDEAIKYFECTYDEALELMEWGYITDSNSMLTLERSKQYMKVGK